MITGILKYVVLINLITALIFNQKQLCLRGHRRYLGTLLSITIVQKHIVGKGQDVLSILPCSRKPPQSVSIQNVHSAEV